MGRLGHRMLEAVVVALIVMCVATAAVWAWSWFRVDTLMYHSHRSGPDQWVGWTATVTTGGGRVMLDVQVFRIDASHAASIKAEIASRYAWRPRGVTTYSNPVDERIPYWIESPSPWNRLGFEWFDDHGRTLGKLRDIHYRGISVMFPHWSAIGVLGTMVGLWIVSRWRWSRRAKKGHCVACGYDLRATPGRCPECGAGATAGGP